MPLISLSQSYSAPKNRPKRYKARDAPYFVGGRKGKYIAALPRDYPTTPQQNKVKKVAAECNIKPGISKSALMTAMVDCVGPKMRK